MDIIQAGSAIEISVLSHENYKLSDIDGGAYVSVRGISAAVISRANSSFSVDFRNDDEIFIECGGKYLAIGQDNELGYWILLAPSQSRQNGIFVVEGLGSEEPLRVSDDFILKHKSSGKRLNICNGTDSKSDVRRITTKSDVDDGSCEMLVLCVSSILGTLDSAMSSPTVERIPFVFRQDSLGLVLKRLPEGNVLIRDVKPGTEAESLGVLSNDVVHSMQGMDLYQSDNGLCIPPDKWSTLLEHLQKCPRPIEIVVNRKLSGTRLKASSSSSSNQASDAPAVGRTSPKISDVALQEARKLAFDLEPCFTSKIRRTSSGLSSNASQQVLPTYVGSFEGRLLIRSGVLKMMSKGTLWGSGLAPKHVFLFDDILVISTGSQGDKPSKSEAPAMKYAVEMIIHLSICKIKGGIHTYLTDDGDPLPTETLFGRVINILVPNLGSVSSQQAGISTVQLISSSASERLEWEQDLFGCIVACVLQLDPTASTYPGWMNQFFLGTIHSAVLSGNGFTIDSILSQGNKLIDIHDELLAFGQSEGASLPFPIESLPPTKKQLVKTFLCPDLTDWKYSMDKTSFGDRVEDLIRESGQEDMRDFHDICDLDILEEMETMLLSQSSGVNGDSDSNVSRDDVRKTAKWALVNTKDSSGFTPVHYACIIKSVDALSILLQSDARIDCRDRFGLTPLHWSSVQVLPDMISILACRSPAIDARDRLGRSPLYLCAVAGLGMCGPNAIHGLERCLSVIKHLGGDVNAVDYNRKTPLHVVSMEWNSDAVEALLRVGAYPNLTCPPENFTPLHLACSVKDVAQSSSVTQNPQSYLYSVAKRVQAISATLQRDLTLSTPITTSPQDVADPDPVQAQAEKSNSSKGLFSFLSRGSKKDVIKEPVASVKTQPSQEDEVRIQPSPSMAPFIDPSISMTPVSPERNSDSLVEVVKSLLSFGAWTNCRDNLRRTPLDLVVEGVAKLSFQQTQCILSAIEHGARPPPNVMDRVKSAPSVTSALQNWSWKGNLDVSAFGKQPLLAWSDDMVMPGLEPVCKLCGAAFSFFKRQHHCRICGSLVCGECSSKTVIMSSSTSTVMDAHGSPVQQTNARVCDGCYSKCWYDIQDPSRTQPYIRTQATSASKSQAKSEPSEAQKSKAASKVAARPTTSDSVSSTKNELAMAQEQLNIRGKKLDDLAQRTQDLSQSANQFAAMSKKLKQESESWW